MFILRDIIIISLLLFRNSSFFSTQSYNCTQWLSFTSISRREMYMVHVGELVHKYGSHDLVSGSAARDGAGTLIGCVINSSNGFLTFTLNKKELPNKFQVG